MGMSVYPNLLASEPIVRAGGFVVSVNVPYPIAMLFLAELIHPMKRSRKQQKSPLQLKSTIQSLHKSTFVHSYVFLQTLSKKATQEQGG